MLNATVCNAPAPLDSGVGHRRRHKNPSSISSAPPMPVPRLADHLDTADGPSDEEGEKDAKRQRSEPTTSISTSSRPPHEYDEVMGITQVEPKLKGLKRGLSRNSKMLKRLKPEKLVRV